MVASVILAGLILMSLVISPAGATIQKAEEIPSVDYMATLPVGGIMPSPIHAADINLSVTAWNNGHNLYVFVKNTGDDLIGNYSLVLYRGLKSQLISFNGTLRRNDTEEIGNVPYFEAKGAELRTQTGELVWRAENISVEYF